MGWIQTYTGKHIDALAMKASDVCIEDIAHSLSLRNRFAGHCPVGYSVAQHSIAVAQAVAMEHKKWGLLHDAHEAYTGVDMPRPLKQGLRDRGVTLWDDLEAEIDEVIAAHFGLPYPCPPEVKVADNLLLVTERRAFFGASKGYADWETTPEKGHAVIWPAIIQPWTAEQAERNFLLAWSMLKGENHV